MKKLKDKERALRLGKIKSDYAKSLQKIGETGATAGLVALILGPVINIKAAALLIVLCALMVAFSVPIKHK